MENLSWQVEQFTMNRRKCGGIRIKEYFSLRELKGAGAAWAYSHAAGDMVGEKTKQYNGQIIIKKENIIPDDLLVLFVEGEYFALHIRSIDDHICTLTAWNIEKGKAKQIMRRKEAVA
jgi:hypothetical protein